MSGHPLAWADVARFVITKQLHFESFKFERRSLSPRDFLLNGVALYRRLRGTEGQSYLKKDNDTLLPQPLVLMRTQHNSICGFRTNQFSAFHPCDTC